MPPGPAVSRREYLGCALWVAAFGVLVVISFSVGLMLRSSDDGPVILAEGGAGAGAYRLEGQRDEAGDPCLTLFRPDADGGEVETAGQCGFTVVEEPSGGDDGDPTPGAPYVVTAATLPDGTTVVFAPVPDEAAEVRLRLADGSQPVVEVERSGDADLRWFLYEADSAVDGPAQLVGADGTPISPP